MQPELGSRTSKHPPFRPSRRRAQSYPQSQFEVAPSPALRERAGVRVLYASVIGSVTLKVVLPASDWTSIRPWCRSTML